MTDKQHKRVAWIGIVAMVLVGLCGLWMLRAAFDTSEIEAKAKSLVGKEVSDIETQLGKPDKKLPKDDFNRSEREAILHSYFPKKMPTARGPVWIYNRMPTLIVIFSDGSKVTDVYVGRT